MNGFCDGLDTTYYSRADNLAQLYRVKIFIIQGGMRYW